MDPTQRQSAPKFARIPLNGAYVGTTKYIIEPAALPAHQIKSIFKAIGE
ncbi:hypothetical protein FOTG_18685 [Fusarium oxysporum f. sp. vasinfectum 25433]|uniref:Uncharacterized protein n=1 Tax=Fusarium oxysporum f. sp. vasinfectum 25433 TaxID=1089449 RepID=X0KVP6_FUSOX|nr:hypothetical protein FOTG_18685 [Fusarium oxysporum f. sp. vasinfectum 25433]